MDSRVFKSTSRRIVLELLAVAAFTYRSRLPEGESYADGWTYVVTHPLLLLHVLVSTLVLVEGVVLVVRSLRARQVAWSVPAIIGALSVLGAFVYGDRLVAGQDGALNGMTVGWVVAMLCYSVGWYLGRRQQAAQRQATHAAES